MHMMYASVYVCVFRYTNEYNLECTYWLNTILVFLNIYAMKNLKSKHKT